jgi:hypothetical protein
MDTALACKMSRLDFAFDPCLGKLNNLSKNLAMAKNTFGGLAVLHEPHTSKSRGSLHKVEETVFLEKQLLPLERTTKARVAPLQRVANLKIRAGDQSCFQRLI